MKQERKEWSNRWSIAGDGAEHRIESVSRRPAASVTAVYATAHRLCAHCDSGCCSWKFPSSSLMICFGQTKLQSEMILFSTLSLRSSESNAVTIVCHHCYTSSEVAFFFFSINTCAHVLSPRSHCSTFFSSSIWKQLFITQYYQPAQHSVHYSTALYSLIFSTFYKFERLKIQYDLLSVSLLDYLAKINFRCLKFEWSIDI